MQHSNTVNTKGGQLNSMMAQETALNMLTLLKGRQMRITTYIDAIQTKSKHLALHQPSNEYADFDAGFSPPPVFDLGSTLQPASPRHEMITPLKITVRASPSRDNSLET